MVNNSILHYTIVRFIIDHGYGPEVNELSQLLDTPAEDVAVALKNLEEDHGVVLHPNSSKIWVIHPFSLAPTNFLVYCDDGEWWSNCAWCSLGVAALLDRDVAIRTTIGAKGKQVEVHIQDGRVVEDSYLVHFPVPMRDAWNNVIYTCSTMLLFENEQQIDEWSERHRIAKGDVQPITNVWEFSRVWYGKHLDRDWKKWTTGEAKDIFEQFGLLSDTWQIPVSDSRF